ncbi:hypothetical protein GCM10022226_80350 [Sphaerisporangium flaviroseum]|uniref:Uncharacterized protein n=1 Tax=Sphaerisporangium flaviroseum TaxID=509199 RepID=A0ABP7JJG8_9ACTN
MLLLVPVERITPRQAYMLASVPQLTVTRSRAPRPVQIRHTVGEVGDQPAIQQLGAWRTAPPAHSPPGARLQGVGPEYARQPRP